MDENKEDVPFVTMATKNGDGIKLMRYQDDVFMPSFMLKGEPDQKMKRILDIEYKTGDIILCTFVKCGTHWVGNMVSRLQGGETDNSKPAFRGLEMSTPDDIAAHPSPRVLITHLWAKRLPSQHVSKGGKTILVLRNPKDMAVSLYHHIKNAVTMSNKQTWDEYFASFLQGHIPWGSYFDFLTSWDKELKEKTRSLDVEVFFYEDFIADCFGQLKRLAEFLGFDKSDEELKKITDACSLANLKERAKTGSVHKGLADKNGQSVIYRKGCIGDWRNHFTVAQNEQFDAIIREKNMPFEFNYGKSSTS